MRMPLPKGRNRKVGNHFKYDIAFMRQIVSDYLDGYQTTKEVAARYDVTVGSLNGWVRRYKHGMAPFDIVPLPPMPTQPQQDDQQGIQKENQALLKKLEEANLKITGLEIMIDIAEEQLGIDIRKKSGTKQS